MNRSKYSIVTNRPLPTDRDKQGNYLWKVQKEQVDYAYKIIVPGANYRYNKETLHYYLDIYNENYTQPTLWSKYEQDDESQYDGYRQIFYFGSDYSLYFKNGKQKKNQHVQYIEHDIKYEIYKHT